jgi:hypothetical protein
VAAAEELAEDVVSAIMNLDIAKTTLQQRSAAEAVPGDESAAKEAVPGDKSAGDGVEVGKQSL